MKNNIMASIYSIRKGWYGTKDRLFYGRFGVFLPWVGCIGAFKEREQAVQFIRNCKRFGYTRHSDLQEMNQCQLQITFKYYKLKNIVR